MHQTSQKTAIPTKFFKQRGEHGRKNRETVNWYLSNYWSLCNAQRSNCKDPKCSKIHMNGENTYPVSDTHITRRDFALKLMKCVDGSVDNRVRREEETNTKDDKNKKGTKKKGTKKGEKGGSGKTKGGKKTGVRK